MPYVDHRNGSRGRPSPVRARVPEPRQLQHLVDRWISELEAGPGAERPKRPERGQAPNGDAQEPARVLVGQAALDDELVATFDDDFGGRVALRETEGALVHDGTVLTRGPLSRLAEHACGAGLSEEAARALDGVVAYFGAPFDFAGPALRDEEPVAWGFWPLSGAGLAHALASWKQAATASFEPLVVRYRIDVTDGNDGAPRLHVSDSICGGVAQGDDAGRLIAGEPRLLAALARAGRHPDAQRAQVTTVVERLLRPVLADARLRAFTAPPLLALLFYRVLADRRRGASTLADLLEGVDTTALARAPWETLIPRLRREAPPYDLHAVRRIFSSPELSLSPGGKEGAV